MRFGDRLGARDVAATLPGLLLLWVGFVLARGFVGDDVWTVLAVARAPTWRALLDPTCVSPLGSAVVGWLAGRDDPLPVASAVGRAGMIVAVISTVIATRRAGAGPRGAAVAGALLAAWPGVAAWGVGSPAFGLATGLTAAGAVAMSLGGPGPAAAAGVLWFLAVLARPEAGALPIAAFLVLVGNRRWDDAARMLLVALSLGVAFAAARTAVWGVPVKAARELDPIVAPWVITLLPPMVAGVVAEVSDRAARWPRWASIGLVTASVGGMLATDAVLAPPLTSAVARARVDADAGKWLVRHTTPGERVRGAPDAVSFYAPDLVFGDDGDWAVTHGPAPEGYAVVRTWPDGPTVARRGEVPPPLADAIPKGLGPPVHLRDGTVLYGGIVPARAFVGEGLQVDAWLDPRGPIDASARVELELWQSGGSSPYLKEAHVPGDGTWPGDRWADGQHVHDGARIAIPPDLAPGPYYVIWRLVVGDEPVEAPPFRSGRVQLGVVQIDGARPEVWIPVTRPSAARHPVPPKTPQPADGVPLRVTGTTSVPVGGDDHAWWVAATGPTAGATVATAATLDAATDGPLAGVGPTVRDACAPVFVPVGDLRLAVFGVDALSPEQAATSARPGACHVDPGRPDAWDGRFRDAVRAARTRADVVLFGVRWSEAGSNWPGRTTRTLARTLLALGADAIVGTGAGRIQGIDVIDGRPVLYDAGALTDGADAAVFTLVLTRDGVAELRAMAVDATPDGPRPSDGNTTSNTLRRIRDLSAVLGTRVALTRAEAVLSLRPGPRTAPPAPTASDEL